MLVVQSLLLSIGMDAFGYLKTIVQRYLYNFEASNLQEEKKIDLNSQKTCACTLDEFGLRFWPPLYLQRYMIVQEILEHPIWNGSIKKVVDFGCSELGMFKCIKPVPGLNNIMLVDVDYDILDMSLAKVMPTNYDYLSMSERKEPLTVDIYHGSIADLDDRMLGIDAVLCVELIEHVYSDVLDAIPHTVFDFIKPKLAVFTTPNVEFNVLFPNFTGPFRHYDHKFEWNREQFQKWAKQIIVQYPEYAVQFDGIGAGPSGTDQLGCCSQMAIFYRNDMKTSPVDPIGAMPYKLMRRVVYPFNQDDENTIRERTVYDRLRTFVSKASLNKKYIVDDKLEIPLNEIMPCVSDCCSSIDELENLVGKLYHTKKNNHGEWLLSTTVLEYSSDDSKSDSLSNHSGQEYSLLEDIENDDDDWDAPVDMNFEKSKLCYSTPMTKNHEVYSNDMDSFNTVNSNSDLFKTAVDYDKSKNMDMDISSSCNSSIIVDNCNVYEDFVMGRKNSTIDEEDVNVTEETLTNIPSQFYKHTDKANDNKVSFYSTPMTKNHEVYSNNMDSYNTVNSNSDLFRTAIIDDESENIDMDISSSYNGNIIVDNCKVYEDFVMGRKNSSMNEEDINGTEETLKNVVNNQLHTDPDIENSINIFSTINCSTDTANNSQSKLDDLSNTNINEESKEIDDHLPIYLDRTLLDENDYTEKLLCTPDK